MSPTKFYFTWLLRISISLCLITMVVVLYKIPNFHSPLTIVNAFLGNLSILNNQTMNAATSSNYKSFSNSDTSPSATAEVPPMPRKVVLFWDDWFGGQWNARFRDQDTLESDGCPSFQCEFTYDKRRQAEANAVMFCRSKVTNMHDINRFERPASQRWIAVDVESPTSSIFGAAKLDSVFNWISTYHSSADFLSFYGYFTSLNYSVRATRPNFMDYGSDVMNTYLDTLAKSANETSFDILSSFGLPSFASRNKLAAWMSSHCKTLSGRENLVKQLQKYIEIDIYGTCGKLSCGKRLPYDPTCWLKTLAPNYLFYLSFENNLCDEYITEKLYNPLFYGIIPVVYGGANYSKFLPPNSYIDATLFTPQELASVMLKIKSNPRLFERFHLWRKFWKVHVGGSFCELCHKLHSEIKENKIVDVRRFRKREEQCYRAKF